MKSKNSIIYNLIRRITVTWTPICGAVSTFEGRSRQSTIKEKMATGTFTYNALRTKTLKEHIKTQRKIVSPSNSTRAMLLV